ncbi:peptidyl-tRNA hydrolase [Fimicolochytrium jonesii]|uniref:peptidyl-tRNA hydrolase n=1 Tax=Fimicolochytrium jonesii TaxID=1396493 RepID=UPI0022FE2298|nr:peptidyl-tRNA hydrolase [Fimicolochytrium jonesii]KAI8816996.1 peptidyl-tRNA hydrolase [Fimicolochytrium jonesii]
MPAASTTSLSRLLIVGLGNHSLPLTRHNVGMMALDYSVKQLGASVWKLEKGVGGFVAEMPGQRRVVFYKAKGYMNTCGGSVARAAREYGVAPEDVVVLQDDLERKVGAVSIKNAGSAGGHNGTKSIIASLRTDKFRRIRIGIGRPATKSQSEVGDYVLTKFGESEMEVLREEAFPGVLKVLVGMIDGGGGGKDVAPSA